MNEPADRSTDRAGPRSTTARPRWSNEADWDLARQEWFAEGGLVFDVSLLKRYLATHRIPIKEVALAELAEWAQPGISARGVGKRAARLRSHRVADADPTLPLLLVRIGAKPFLVDGHHRLERARQLGVLLLTIVVIKDRSILRRSLKARSSLAANWWLGRTALRAPRRAGPDSVPTTAGPARRARSAAENDASGRG